MKGSELPNEEHGKREKKKGGKEKKNLILWGIESTSLPFYYLFPILLLNADVLKLTVIHGHGTNTLPGNATDRLALLLFKAQISNDPFGSLTTWNETNTSLHYCDWHGVTCGSPRHPKRVTALSLISLNLNGTLSPYLANLTFLYSLNLSSNNVHGFIPQDLGRLSRLRYLDLRHNLLEGEIPQTLTLSSKLRGICLEVNNLVGRVPENFSRCLDLHIINFSGNELVGTIPASFSSLPKIVKLGLSKNKLEGSIPPSFGNLSTISALSLASNNLEGCIPEDLSRINSLERLSLELNRLSCEIPHSLFNISSIYYFNVGNNNLSGTLPQDIGITLPHLQFFYVFYNKLGGHIPTSLSNATELQVLILHGNRFLGLIPPNLGFLRNLTALDFGLNRIEAREVKHWDFLTSLSNCSNLDSLYLSQNNLQGILPNSIANLSSHLRWLAMAGNQISGVIPQGIGKYNRLTVFDMTLNLLTGTIPSTIGMLQNLHMLDMSGNQFHGEIPSSIDNLTLLNELLLAENKLQGSIPSSVGNLVYLNALDLSYNKLNGTIPGQALSQLSSLSQYLRLSHNSLSGSLPSQVSNLINLNELDVSENRLTGEIPGSFGSCQLLQHLFMQGNFFTGNIPSGMSGLKGIEELDLSRNNLSGSIPEFLERFHFITYLNLSFNNLEGQVPQGGVFGNASAISLQGNSKLCRAGQEYLYLPLCDSTNESSIKSSSKLKIIIPAVVTSILFILVSASYCIKKQRKRANPPPIPFLKEPFNHISYAKIHNATDGFSSSNLVGAGSFGTVYKGILDSDSQQVVPIKVLNLEQRGADKSFMAECNSLRVIRHRNLVNIVTICSSIDHNGNDFKALVFEYMPNGSLDEWLHPRKDEDGVSSKCLSVVQRWHIVMDVALALDYLHHHCQMPIVHCDLKPSNILLDHDMGAHVGDFGLSRFLRRTISSSQDTNSKIGLKGSIGYIAPEYGTGGAITTQGDVYSYGVLLLETFTGKRPTDDMFESDLNLHKYVKMAYPDQVLDIVDPSIALSDGGVRDDYAKDPRGWIHEFMISIFRIGLLCSKESSNERIDIADVIRELLLARKIFDGLD